MLPEQIINISFTSGDRLCQRHDAILLLLILKVGGSAWLGEIDLHPIGPKTPAQQYQPIDREKREGKIVEDKKG